jgi:hypothetical protein
MHKTDKALANLMKKRREKTQINKIRNEKEGDNKHQRNKGNHQGLI